MAWLDVWHCARPSLLTRGAMGLALVGAAWFGPSPAGAAVVPAQIVARAGDVPPGSALPVSTTRPPFVLADGTVAFVGTLSDGDVFVYVGNQVVWQGSDAMMSVLTSTEASMGGTVGGGFIYSPLVDGSDGIWSHNGLLSVVGGPAPGYPAGVSATFNSRPRMVDNGAAYWVGGINSSGGGLTEARVFYRSPTAMPGDAQVLLASGDMLGGLLVEGPIGVGLNYDVSSNDAHWIHVVDMDTGSSTTDGHIVVDGVLLYQESTPNGSGDDWDNHDLVAINDQGLYVMSGDTNGAFQSDEYVAVNGTIGVREGDVVGGIPLTTSATVRSIAVNNAGRIVHAWSYGGGATETAFLACDPNDLVGSSIPIITTGIDQLDLDGDGVGDVLVTDIEASTASSSKGLGDDGSFYAEVDLDDGITTLEAMVRIPVTCCGNAVVDSGEQCDDGNGDDTDACPTTCQSATCGDGFAWAGTEECDDGNLAQTDACLDNCVAATCGDGFLWAGVEACDDGNGDDTDGCPGNCMPAACGDGFVWAGMEQCDDGNADQTDACLDNCVAAACGDGILWAGTETCDDGNLDDSDACPSSCQDAFCGDGFVWDGMEECDDGNDDDTDGCTSACMVGPVGGSSDSSGGMADTTGEPPGTTDDGGSSGSTSGSGGTTGAMDDEGTTTAPLPLDGSGSDGSSGSTGVGPFEGLDDDGGCVCSAAPGRWRSPLGGLIVLLLGWPRRRRG